MRRNKSVGGLVLEVTSTIVALKLTRDKREYLENMYLEGKAFERQGSVSHWASSLTVLTSQQALSCHHVCPCPRGSWRGLFKPPVCSHTRVLVSSAPWSYAASTHLSQYQLLCVGVGGGEVGGKKFAFAVPAVHGVWRLRGQICRQRGVSSCGQQEKGQFPLDTPWQNDVSAAT